MLSKPTIRTFLALGILLIFSISITPKRYLHDLFAAHKDIVTNTASGGELSIHQKGFTCDCDTLVATSPFTDYRDEIIVAVPLEFPSLFVSLTTLVHASSHSFIELRGPPSLG